MRITVWLRSLGAACAVCTLVCLVGCQDYMSPAPTLVVERGRSYYDAVPPPLRTPDIELLYVTDRLRSDTESRPVWYGYGRDTRPSYGLCTVAFGRGLTWDQLADRTSRSGGSPLPMNILRVTELGRLPSSLPQLEMIDGKLVEKASVIADRDEFVAEFREALAKRLAEHEKKDVWVFIHGYNNQFQWPMYIMAQIWHYMGRQGVPIVYTWPAGSPGLIRGYNHDRESGEFTIRHLKGFLTLLGTDPNVDRVHLIAHSRGTDVAMTALRELNIAFKAQGKSTAKELKLHDLILAAPDLDIQVAGQRITAERMDGAADRFTIYVSSGDKAINAADWLFSSKNRLGRLRYDEIAPEGRANLSLLKGFSIIDVTLTTIGNGHSYFYENPQVLSDVILMLTEDRDPGAAHGRPLIKKADGWWELDKNYLLPKRK